MRARERAAGRSRLKHWWTALLGLYARKYLDGRWLDGQSGDYVRACEEQAQHEAAAAKLADEALKREAASAKFAAEEAERAAEAAMREAAAEKRAEDRLRREADSAKIAAEEAERATWAARREAEAIQPSLTVQVWGRCPASVSLPGKRPLSRGNSAAVMQALEERAGEFQPKGLSNQELDSLFGIKEARSASQR